MLQFPYIGSYMTWPKLLEFTTRLEDVSEHEVLENLASALSKVLKIEELTTAYSDKSWEPLFRRKMAPTP